MEFSISIITVQDRLKSTLRLKASLEAAFNLSVSVYVDKERRGIWWNTKRVLLDCVASNKPVLLFQDDALLTDYYKDNLDFLFKWFMHNEVGLLSLFTPPRGTYVDLKNKGFNMVVSTDFLWAQNYMIKPSFALQAIEIGDALTEAAGNFEEVRYRVAAQKNGIFMATVIGSLVSHDLNLKSTVGTPAKVGTTVRNTRIIAEAPDYYKNIVVKYTRPSIKDLKYLKNEI